MISTNYRQIKDAKDIESILCLSTLINKKKLPDYSTVKDSDNYYNNLAGGCEFCPFNQDCLACIINE